MSPKAFIISSLIVLLTHLGVCEVSGNECGKVELLIPTVTKAAATVRGAWPFLAALYHVEDSKFFCGAAHCVQQKGSTEKLEPADILVLLGAYNLDRKVETGTEQREVEKIYMHPDWRAFNEKYDADLAILVFREIVTFTRYIRPICLPGDDPPVDAKGSIVGWGLSEKAIADMRERESTPRQAYTKILNDSYCYTSQHFLASFSSTRLFCGGGAGGSPNKGDSGGGLFVLSGSAWTQYGIISASLADNRGFVLPDSFSLYTNVRAFKRWIDKTLIESGSVVMSVVEMEKVKISFLCDYEHPSGDVYKCEGKLVNVTSPNSEVDAIIGMHLPGYYADDVTEVWFWTYTLEYIPDGIGKKFKFLERFLVGYGNSYEESLGLKRLQRSNFKDMELLQRLDVSFNYVDTVEEDTLWDLPNIIFFIIKNNKLKMLHRNTFARNGKLTLVDAESNQLEFLPYNLFKNNPMLEKAVFKDNKLKIISTDFTHLSSIKKIDFYGNNCIDQALEDVNSVTNFQILLNDRCSTEEDRHIFS